MSDFINIQQQNANVEEARKKAHFEAFDNFLKTHTDKKESTSIIITQEKYDTIIRYLDGSIQNPDPNKRFHFKKQMFNIQIVNGETKLYQAI